MDPSSTAINPFQEDASPPNLPKSASIKPKQTLEEYRIFIRSLVPNLKVKPASKRPSPFMIPVDQAYHMKVECYRPNRARPHLGWPTVFYIPGTSFISEETEYTDAICKHLAYVSGAQILVLRPRTSPEVVFPIPLEDVKAAFLNILSQDLKYMHRGFDIDQRLMILAGYSSGANLALSLAIELKDSMVPGQILKQILVSPVLDMKRAYDIANRKGLGGIDNNDFTNTVVMKPETMKLMFDQLLHQIHRVFQLRSDEKLKGLADHEQKRCLQAEIDACQEHEIIEYLTTTPSLSAFNRQDVDTLRDLPFTQIIYGGRDDVCHDDSKALIHKFRQLGIPVEQKRWNDVNHSMIWQHDEILKGMGESIKTCIAKAQALLIEDPAIFSLYDDSAEASPVSSPGTLTPRTETNSLASSNGVGSPEPAFAMSCPMPESLLSNSEGGSPQTLLRMRNRHISEQARRESILTSSRSQDSLNTPQMAGMQIQSPLSSSLSSSSLALGSPKKLNAKFTIGASGTTSSKAQVSRSLSSNLSGFIGNSSPGAGKLSQSDAQMETKYSRSIFSSSSEQSNQPIGQGKPPLSALLPSGGPNNTSKRGRQKHKPAKELSQGSEHAQGLPVSILVGSTLVDPRGGPKT